MMDTRHSVAGLAVLVLVGLVGSSAPSCSSQEFVPSTGGNKGDASVGGSHTGGTGGTGGATGGTSGGGTGGATGGTGGTGGCKGNADCDNHLACDGTETCTGGACVQGTPVDCSNPDSTHCDVACVEGADGGTSCAVKGKDADSDQHLDAACTASSVTADDCDDTRSTVHPGAAEICDGLDNDCNDKDEIEEGTALAGGASDFVKGTFIAENPALAWSAANKLYGVVWNDDRAAATNQIYFARMSADGTKLGATGSQEVALSVAGGTAPRIAWGNSVFGVVWQNASKVVFRRFDVTGTPLGNPTVVSDSASKASDPDIVPIAGGWIAIWSDVRTNTWGSLYARQLSADGAPVGSADTQVGPSSGSNHLPRAATNGTDVLVNYLHGANAQVTVVKALGLSSSLGVSNDKSLSTDPAASGVVVGTSAIAPTSAGWALAWREGGTTETIHLYEQLANGSAGCAATSLPTPQIGVPGGIATRGNHRIVAYGSDAALQAKVMLARFKGGCALPTTHTLASAEVPSFDPRGAEVSWNDNGAAVVYTDYASGKGVIVRWVAGPNLCDAPVP